MKRSPSMINNRRISPIDVSSLSDKPRDQKRALVIAINYTVLVPNFIFFSPPASFFPIDCSFFHFPFITSYPHPSPHYSRSSGRRGTQAFQLLERCGACEKGAQAPRFPCNHGGHETRFEFSKANPFGGLIKLFSCPR